MASRSRKGGHDLGGLDGRQRSLDVPQTEHGYPFRHCNTVNLPTDGQDSHKGGEMAYTGRTEPLEAEEVGHVDTPSTTDANQSSSLAPKDPSPPPAPQEPEPPGIGRPPRKTNTAPSATQTNANNTRPRLSTRSSTFINRKRRVATGGGVPPSRRELDPWRYDFKHVESDSESSNSSDDDEDEDADDGEYGEDLGGREEEEQQERTERTEMPEAASQRDDGTERKHGKKSKRQMFTLGNDFFKTKGRISKRDGRLKLSINEVANTGYIAKALGHLDIAGRDKNKQQHKGARNEEGDDEDAPSSTGSSLPLTLPHPRMNIVIMVIGSRGDIQPFLKLGKLLQHDHGHRVRIASHPTFRNFVERDAGLEFFSVGGDPSELMAFMVKNPGLIPSMQTVREGEIAKRRAAMAEMFEGFWRACINASEDEHDDANLRLMGEKQPFIADAIIANPPSMAHVHIAERLGIPLHMMFTFPYSPTVAFPHPLANIKQRKSNVDARHVNFISYPLVEMMTWQGLGDIVNRFREHTLGLEPVSSLWAPGALYRMKVPYTYLWSPSLVPKPDDWGPEIDLAGFVFLDLASSFTPPPDLADFLAAGDPPVYIGFGSIVVDDPDRFTQMIFRAASLAGVRALVNKGWGGLGADNADTPAHIFMLDNTPHDWLFPRVKAVVHHGGAGTTAIGLKCARPTMIVPFFGDQPFWGARMAEAKAGAHKFIPYKKLTAERLAEGIKQCLTEDAQRNVQQIADAMAREGDGAANAVASFHRGLPLAGRRNMRCSILQDRVAVWGVRGSSLRLSALAAEILREDGKLEWRDVKLLRHYEWNDFDGPGEPVTGGFGALSDSLYGIGEGMGMVPVRIAKHLKEFEEHERRKRARRKKREERAKQKRTATSDQEAAKNVYDDDDLKPAITREPTNLTLASALSADAHSEPLPKEVAEDIQSGVKRAGFALLTMPNDLHVAVAQGLHNAPRLWGDGTVRKPVKITGVKSGFRAARQELVFGMYDGWTGLVRMPRDEWAEAESLPAKLAGLGTGIGKGIGGFVLKNANAAWAPPAYVAKGFIQYAAKLGSGPGAKGAIRRAQIVQGEIDLRALQEEDERAARAKSGSEAGGESAAPLKLPGVRARVAHGWGVYASVWRAAHAHFGSPSSSPAAPAPSPSTPASGKRASKGGINPLRRLRFHREAARWARAGALESVDTADAALKAAESGEGMEGWLRRRRAELEGAERPRVGGMERVAEAEALPHVGSLPPAETQRAVQEGATGKKGDEDGRGLGEGREEGDMEPGEWRRNEEEGEDERRQASDSTAVATPDGDAAGEDETKDVAQKKNLPNILASAHGSVPVAA